MSPEELRERVDTIIACAGDDEGAHSMKDALHLIIINAFCPDWVVAEINRLNAADFMRWCA